MISAGVSPVLPCISRVKYLLLVANTSVIVNIFKKKKINELLYTFNHVRLAQPQRYA